MPMPHRRPDTPAELSDKPRGWTWGPPQSEAWKDDGGVPAREPTEEERQGNMPTGPNYAQALNNAREYPVRMCVDCGRVPSRSRLALRCLECETVHRKATRRKADAARRHKAAAGRGTDAGRKR